MQYLKIEKEFPKFDSCVITLGKFDGIHLGHKKLVDKVIQKKRDGVPAVLFSLGAAEKMIFTREEREHTLEEKGIDVLIECPLSKQIRSMSPVEFIKQILIDRFHVKCVVVGEDFRFGYERKGNPRLLEQYGKKYGYETIVIPKEMYGKRKISSTFIREELEKGRMESVSRLLGHNYYADGVVEHGNGIGHKKLLPTINLIPSTSKLMPPNGVYMTITHFKHVSYPGITNVGYKPTIGEKFVGIETYLFGCDEDLYEQPCRVEFFHFSRPEKKFESLDALKKQLAKDEEDGKAFFEKKKN
ncbi:MAG: bifunctional riboflavin kinase/FAD synthetase [Eubacteriales bacterium]|nr:bifunctional riboflavin kinase/FAD synthetase [Eubacteriales bacterium]